MFLRKHNVTAASGIGPHEWKPGADVTEVPDELGADLLALGGYSVAEPPKAPNRGRESRPPGTASRTQI